MSRLFKLSVVAWITVVFAAGSIHAQDLQPLKLYNVKKGSWHTHTLSKDAVVLIVENRDTSSSNSSETVMEGSQRKELIELTKQLWKDK